jgi:hypothetical protein
MITPKGLHKARVLAFWEKHGISATMEAFDRKRSTLFLWKKQHKEGKGKIEALNERSRTPHNKRKQSWPILITSAIRNQRDLHPNIGKDKLHVILAPFCEKNNLILPSISTIGRIIKDCGGLRLFPKKVYHNGRIAPIKRKKVLRKPKNFKAEYAGHCVALDTVERFVHGLRRYIITFEDIHTRFAFAWGTSSHASLAAKEFFEYCRMVFPHPFVFVLTDNGSEFMKYFDEELRRLHLLHYHTYPRTPKMNARMERFNRTIQEEFVDYHAGALLDPSSFNQQLIPWLVWYNTERPHWGLDLKSPMQYMLTTHPEKSNMRWTDTQSCFSRQI